MSEELKEKADAFCGSRGIVCPNAWMVALMAEFAAQVCEQREKELGGELQSELELSDSRGKRFEEQRAISIQLQQRAEAAELALRSRDKRISELGADICNMNDSIAEIVCQDLADWDWKTCVERTKNVQDALQATEQELAGLKRMTTAWAEQKAADLEIEKAQARQQAVADLREEYKAVVETGQAMSNVFFNTAQLKEYPADYREKANALRVKWDEARRSLTPPPALTKEK